MLTTTEGNLTDAIGVRLLERFSHDSERLRLHFILWSYEVRAIEKLRRQLVGLDELSDLHGRRGLDWKCLQFVRIDFDVPISGVFIAFDNISLLHLSV